MVNDGPGFFHKMTFESDSIRRKGFYRVMLLLGERPTKPHVHNNETVVLVYQLYVRLNYPKGKNGLFQEVEVVEPTNFTKNSLVDL